MFMFNRDMLMLTGEFLEIFTVATGVIFLLLEIRQSNWMWAVQMLSGAASAALFFREGLYAAMALNVYYVLTALWGFVSWRRDAGADGTPDSRVTDSGGVRAIHLRRIGFKVLAVSVMLQLAGTAILFWILRCLEDPSSLMDAGIAVLSLIATWWLIRTYKEQWLLWIMADMLTSVLCLTRDMPWMAALYLFYAGSAVYGYLHWTRNGRYVDASRQEK